VMEGSGVAKAGTGAFTLPVTFPSRIGEPAGRTTGADGGGARRVLRWRSTARSAVSRRRPIAR
jgi:hypothetical protein